MDIDFAFRLNEGLPLTAHRRIREAGPVVWSDTLGGWVVSSYEGVRAVLSDVVHFTMKGTPVAEQLGAEAMLVNDTPLHHVMRAVWAKQVSRSAMAMRVKELEDNAAWVLGAARSRLETGEAVDFIALFQRFVLEFISNSFAIPRDRLDAVARWSKMSADTPALGLEEGSPDHQRHHAAKQDVLDLIRDQVADRKERFRKGVQSEDLTSLMVAAEGRHGITEAMVRDNLFNFVLGALDTTEKWMGNIVITLCTDTGLREVLRADRSLIEPAINEIMRVNTVAQVIMRRVKEHVVLGGQQLKAGEPVFVMLGAANRDPAEFENADTFDMHRPIKANLGFGFGFHHCLGINIARQEALSFINVLLDTFPDLRIVVCDYGNSWALWGPRRLEVAFAPNLKTKHQ
jgi:cytochrome P450